MGLAASQARYLFLTARKGDIEYNQMQIANQKITLSRESAKIAEGYSNALNTSKTTLATTGGTADLSYANIMKYGNTSNQYVLTDANGAVVLNDDDAALIKSLTGTSGTSGSGFSLTQSMEEQYLAKKMGVSDTSALDKYISNYSSTSTTNASSVDTDTLSSNVTDITSILSDMGQGTDVVSASQYSSLKTYLTSLITSAGSSLTNMGATLGDNSKFSGQSSFTSSNASSLVKDPADTTVTNSDAYKELKATYIAAVYSLVALKDTQTQGQGETTETDVGIIKALMTGQKLTDGGDSSASSLGKAKHSTAFRHSNAACRCGDDAQGALNSIVGSTSYTYSGRCGTYTGNATDLTSALSNDSSSSSIPSPTISASNQSQANFYLNQLNKIASSGWRDMAAISDSSQLQNDVTNGSVYIEKYSGNGQWAQATTSDSSSGVASEDDTAAQTKAEAVYKTETAKLNTKEAEMDLKEKNLETERTEIDTEIDSVKNVISKNVERSFKMFA